MTPNPPDELLKHIRKGNRFLLTSHSNPDGDAIGSELALARVLRSQGKGVTLWNRDPSPTVYEVLPGNSGIHVGEEPPAGFPERYSAAIILECPSLDRTGLEDHLEGALPILNIDHHLGNQHYGAVNWVDSAAPAVGAMVYRLAQALRVTLNPELAQLLYLTLVTDTGGFRFSNATSDAFETAAALVREGARPEQVTEWLYESRTEAYLRLLAEMLGSLALHADGRVSTALLTSEMMERAGATPADSEGLTNYPRSIAGVEASALLRELGPGTFKVSLRSKGRVDVEAVARQHGGGGHRNAAGCVIEGSADEVIETLLGTLGPALPGAGGGDAENAETMNDGGTKDGE